MLETFATGTIYQNTTTTISFKGVGSGMYLLVTRNSFKASILYVIIAGESVYPTVDVKSIVSSGFYGVSVDGNTVKITSGDILSKYRVIKLL